MERIEKNQYQKFTIRNEIQVLVDNDNKTAEDVTELCDRICFHPRKILQVGAANSGDLEYMKFIEQGATAILIEPHPKFYAELVGKWGNIPNITIFNVGVADKVGKFKFIEAWASTCLAEYAKIPKLAKDLPDLNNTFECNCQLISGFDEGDIDLLYIDANGADFYSLKHLVSKPIMISIETHNIHNNYENHMIKHIDAWGILNNYTIMAFNESDTVYIKRM